MIAHNENGRKIVKNLHVIRKCLTAIEMHLADADDEMPEVIAANYLPGIAAYAKDLAHTIGA